MEPWFDWFSILFLSAASGIADIEVQISVRLSVCALFLTTFPKSDFNEIAQVYASLKN